MADLTDVDCQVTLQLRRLLATRSRAAAVDFATKHLVAGYASRSFLRDVAQLLKPLPTSRRGLKPQGAEVEYEMVQAYRRAVDWGETPTAARRQVIERFKPPFGDRQFRRKLASWEAIEDWT